MEERTNCTKLPSDLHMCAVVYEHGQTCTHMHTLTFICLFTCLLAYLKKMKVWFKLGIEVQNYIPSIWEAEPGRHIQALHNKTLC